ncbi:MAG TPA: M3 family oligoendopeptidase, partial [Saprospiraceae bacterium]|nr:M3 family oligoendopeptidase [Saprospiraceae bacterium]
MLKFTDFDYQRPDMAAFDERFYTLLAEFAQADSLSAQADCLEQLNTMRSSFMSMQNICHIRHTINTIDKFYEQENDFFDQHLPRYEALNNALYERLLASPFRHELQLRFGRQLFTIAELSQRTFKPVILGDMQQENALSSAYTKLKARAAIEFEGEVLNLSSIMRYDFVADRSKRKAAAEARWNFYAQQKPEMESIFDHLVKTRHRIATRLGFRNFVELGYARMLRSDYNADMVANFREQIRQHIVPIASALYERQRQRLQLDTLYYYDEEVRFRSGNPKPKGDFQWIVNQANKMYAELSPETHEFFNFMRDRDLLDLETRPGKATGGYCTYIDNYRTPFIFSNFNGTSGDIEVLTHEAGHAFQVYESRQIGLREYNWPTYEACEIHSMSMEFFTWPWMPLFFEEETDKFRFHHLSNAICFLPYGVSVDEFQHVVYENPDMTPAERNQAWRDIERKYLPHRNYENNKLLENGSYWLKQNHIFMSPFYYIDYTLAQICAFQFWKRSLEEREEAWND